MLADDGRLSMGEDVRDGKRKLDDFGGLYSLDHTASAPRSLGENSGKLNYYSLKILTKIRLN